ncbi:efflux RND transporter periplasmic adaptor subunit [Brevibacillus sp. B_LB10_24]|uniref:efflux RND transporter periplasmic adaptor subunit n=1 Tax=Brevibacillus sp. B_LB10_24 TaxID=3380645 RepID=UPI0038BA6002
MKKRRRNRMVHLLAGLAILSTGCSAVPTDKSNDEVPAVRAMAVGQPGVSVLVDNPQGMLKAGMIALVSLTGEPQNGREVPASALFHKDDVTYVYVVKGDMLHQTAVTVKPKDDEWVYVTNGLENNDRIVINPAKELAEGMKVRIEEGVES